MMQHTGGPWKVRTTVDKSGDYDMAFYEVWAFPYGEEAGPMGIVSGLTRRDDAVLVASAPDLLATLRCIVAHPTRESGRRSSVCYEGTVSRRNSAGRN
jgi:hypothetical protein